MAFPTVRNVFRSSEAHPTDVRDWEVCRLQEGCVGIVRAFGVDYKYQPDREVYGRLYDGAEKFTNFLNHRHKRHLQARLQLQLPSTAMNFIEWMAIETMGGLLIQERIRAQLTFQVSTERVPADVLEEFATQYKDWQYTGAPEPNINLKAYPLTFEIQLLDKFKQEDAADSSLRPLVICLRYNHLAPTKALDIGCKFEYSIDGQSWKSNLEKWCTAVLQRQIKRDQDVIRRFSDRVETQPAHIEDLFNEELRRRILAHKLNMITPVRPEGLWSVMPLELRQRIWTFAVHVNQSQRLYPYITSNFRPVWLNENHVMDHFLVSRAHYDETRQVVFGESIFVMMSPIKAAQFLRSPAVQLHLPSNIRRLEVNLEPDVMLQFLKPVLGFNYLRSSLFLTNLCGGQSVLTFIADVKALQNPKVQIIVRMPPRYKMDRAFMDGCCHLMLCRWVIKAWETALQEHTELHKNVEYISDTQDISVSPADQAYYARQMHDALDVKRRPELWTWEQLLEDRYVTGLDREAPPDCTCAPLPSQAVASAQTLPAS